MSVELPNWLKISWWVVLTATLSVLLGVFRLDALAGGDATAFDIVAFAIWVALLLVPLFQEVDIFGVKLKQQIDQLASQVRAEITGLRSEIQSTNNMNANVNPNFYFSGSPPSTDERLEKNDELIKRAVGDIAKSYGVTNADQEADVVIATPDEAVYLFQVRFNLEKELRRLYVERLGTEIRNFSTPRVVDDLVRAEVLDAELAYAIREVYAVCSMAIHGRDVSSRQTRFVRDTAPGLIASLRVIRAVEDLP